MNADEPLPPILVADDNPTDVFFLQRRLVAAGISNPLEHVVDGVEAINWIERRLMRPLNAALRPWLVFVDLRMPRMDGFGVLHWIQERGFGEQLTLGVVTTSDEPADIERALSLGAHRFLLKYPRPADLADFVAYARQRAFGRESVRPEPQVPRFGLPRHA